MPLPKLSAIEISGGKFIVWIPSRYTENGKRRKLTFSSMEDVDNWKKEFLKSIEKLGERANALSLANQEDAITALSYLRDNGFRASLMDAARLYVEQMSRYKATELVVDVWTKYEAHTRSQSTHKSVQNRLNILWGCIKNHYSQKTIGSLNAAKLHELISGEAVTPAMYNNRLKTLKAFCNYAVKYSYLDKSPVSGVDKMKTVGGDIVVLSPDQAQSMLNANSEWQHVIALFLFSGIRGAELSRMTWEDIEEEEHHVIRVKAKNSKSGAYRLIDIQPTLQRFLDIVPANRKTGLIMPKGWLRIWKDIRSTAGVQDAKNQCRHSFASYLLASSNDVNYVRSQLGHDTKDILFEHYRALVYKKDAEKYWNIKPLSN